MKYFFDAFRTPFGIFSIAVDENGGVAATAFGDRAALLTRISVSHLLDDKNRTRAAREQILAYAAGERREFSLPLAAPGTPFQQKVWSALARIPFGATRTYGEIARDIRRPTASRAVGRANATNPICLIVPCHRVIGANGSLTGFAFGEQRKRQLLDHELAHASPSRAA